MLDYVAYVDDLNRRNLAFTYPVNDGERGRGYKCAEIKTDVKLPWGIQMWTTLARPVGPPDPKQPAWMRTSETAIAGVPVWTWMVSEPGSQWDDILDWYERASVSVDNRWVLHLDKRSGAYYAAVVYPRAHGKKQNVVTLSNILQGAWERRRSWQAIDAAGINSAGVRIPKGVPSVPATSPAMATFLPTSRPRTAIATGVRLWPSTISASTTGSGAMN